MIIEDSLNITKIEMQKKIIKLLFEQGDLDQNQYNIAISKFDKKIQSLTKKEDFLELKPIVVEVNI